MKTTGEVVGEWNAKSILPKRWDVTYQRLPKVVERLNRLQSIINVYNDNSKLSTSRKLVKDTVVTDGSEMAKYLITAKRISYIKKVIHIIVSQERMLLV